MLTVHHPPIYGYEPTASVGVRFKVFCQNYEHLRREWGGGEGGQGACTEFGRGVGALWRATSLQLAPLIYLSLFG